MPSRAAAEIAGTAVSCVAFALLLLISGSVALAQQPAKPKVPTVAATPKAPDNGKCIGVISAIGDTLFLRKIGMTVFGNEENSAPVDSWHIDDFVADKISAYLSKSWSVKRINYPKGALASLDGQHSLFYNASEDLRGILQRVTSSSKCNYYVLVGKTGSGLGNTNQSIYGLGIVETSSLIMGTHDFAHALFAINIYDGQNFKELGHRGAATQPWSLLGDLQGPGIHGPYREVEHSFWPQAAAVQDLKLRDAIRSLIDQALDKTMPGILQLQ
jgi:hypothetical protein